MKTIDLSGSWCYALDETGDMELHNVTLKNHDFILPGSTCDNKIGIKQEYYKNISKEAVRALRERYQYVGVLWLEREIEIPKEFEGKSLNLFLERVNIASELWIDGIKIGRQIIGLSTPHIYNLTGKLKPGRRTLTLRVDNRNLLNLDNMASGYSIDTQGYWNGIIGKIELQCQEIFHISSIQVYPDEKGIDIKVVQTSDVHSPFKTKSARIDLFVTEPNGNRLEVKQFETKIYSSKQVEYYRYDIDDIKLWNEFEPNLYSLTIKYFCQDVIDEKSVVFGMRTIETKAKEIFLNNKPISLRGTTDCAIYPLTGYPPMDIEAWRKNLSTIKSYGFNHVRFHAWCPPENAFYAADELGLYLLVEMPLWLNHDVCRLELGEDPVHRQYFMQEAIGISKTYGNHPSFIMFSNGNENMGDFELLDDIITIVKAYDNRRIYTVTSNFDHPILPCEDYLCAYEAGGHQVRIQELHDQVADGTFLDYSHAVSDLPVPIISFEIGQYCVYPNVDSTELFTGNMLPTNFAVIKKYMEEKHVYHKLHDYIKASGDLAVKLYKEDIEAALRTKKFGGFQLLSLCDYTGQSTATVGILDVFFQNKGLIKPEKFREFCNEVVPLFKSRRIYKNTEILEAELVLYDYGKEKIMNPEFEFSIYNGDKLFFTSNTKDNMVSVPLNGITKSTILTVNLVVDGYKNSWRIFVFVPNKVDAKVNFVRTQEDLRLLMKNGGRAIVTANCLRDPIKGSFISVFWSPVHFPSQKPCGAIIDHKHPIFEEFPTEKYPDYQWKRLLDNSYGMDITNFGNAFKPIIETVPNFFDNTPSSPLFEARVGNAELLFCGFDLNSDYLECQQLRDSIIKYVTSNKFKPVQNIAIESLLSRTHKMP